MLQILLGICKVIGFLLLFVLLLLIFVLLVVLLGPIGYRAEGAWNEEKRISAGVSWLGYVLRGQVSWRDTETLVWRVLLFGFTLFSNDEEFLKKKEEKELQKEEKRRRKEAAQREREAEKRRKEAEKSRAEAEKRSKEVKKHGAEAEQQKQKPSAGTSTGTISEKKEIAQPSVQRQKPKTRTSKKTIKQPEKEEPVSLQPKTQTSETLSTVQSAEKTAEEPKKKKLTAVIKEKLGFIKEKLQKIKEKINSIIQKIKAVPGKIKTFAAGIKAKIDRILEYKEFFFGERNRAGMLRIWHNLKKMIRHILPRRLKGRIEFGVGDPYTMGQILTVLSIFYPVYQDHFKIVPDFENAGFAGDFSLKGRIIPGYLILRILLAVCSREVIRIIKEGIQLIGGETA